MLSADFLKLKGFELLWLLKLFLEADSA